MTRQQTLPAGVVHPLPGDLEAALGGNPGALATWLDITPLARNEWICWVDSAKKAVTRTKRIAWGCENLSDGKRRPCCWPGCPHRQADTKPQAARAARGQNDGVMAGAGMSSGRSPAPNPAKPRPP